MSPPVQVVAELPLSRCLCHRSPVSSQAELRPAASPPGFAPPEASRQHRPCSTHPVRRVSARIEYQPFVSAAPEIIEGLRQRRSAFESRKVADAAPVTMEVPLRTKGAGAHSCPKMVGLVPEEGGKEGRKQGLVLGGDSLFGDSSHQCGSIMVTIYTFIHEPPVHYFGVPPKSNP